MKINLKNKENLIMANWTFNPNEYAARDFGLIPEGDYKVTINNVVE